MFADIDGILRDLGRIGGETIEALWPKLEDLAAGETHINLNSAEYPVAVITTFESLEPLGLFGGLMLKAVEQSGKKGERAFHLVPIEYLESMCATRDPEVFSKAVYALAVDESWLHWDNDASQGWREVMPDPLPANPLLEAAAREFLWMQESAGTGKKDE